MRKSSTNDIPFIEGFFREARFELDYGIGYRGFTKGDRWNGWECPYFTKEEADILIKHTNFENDKAWYDYENDAYIIDFEHDDYKEDMGHSHTITPVLINRNGEELKVYPIGAFAWTWVEVTSTK